jgi:transcription termination/antitermination protein NusG
MIGGNGFTPGVGDSEFKKGDRVRVTEGTFEGYEAIVDSVSVTDQRLILIIGIFGRPTPIKLEHWQVERLK